MASATTGYAAVWRLLKLASSRSFASFVLFHLVLGLAVLAIAATPFR